MIRGLSPIDSYFMREFCRANFCLRFFCDLFLLACRSVSSNPHLANTLGGAVLVTMESFQRKYFGYV